MKNYIGKKKAYIRQLEFRVDTLANDVRLLGLEKMRIKMTYKHSFDCLEELKSMNLFQLILWKLKQ